VCRGRHCAHAAEGSSPKRLLPSSAGEEVVQVLAGMVWALRKEAET
jgi:hypothetical protein